MRGFRITHTQDSLLNNPSIHSKSSAIVRVLLNLYFNKKIQGVEALIEAELDVVEKTQKKNFDKFREMLKSQKKEKKDGTTDSYFKDL